MLIGNTSIMLINGADTIHVQPRKSLRAKKIIIRVYAHKKLVELVIPKHISLKQATKFLYHKESWIRSKLASTPFSRITIKNNTIIPVLGRNYQILHTGKLRGITAIEDDNIMVCGLEEHIERKIKEFLLNLLRSEADNLASEFSQKLGISYNKISLRDTDSRWGSCSANGNLSFCWRLIFAPRSVFEYVVAHEVCHLVEMNHSVQFWQLVAQLMPDYKVHNQWLKENSHMLEYR